MSVLPIGLSVVPCIYMQTTCKYVVHTDARGFHRTGVTDICELACKCREPNPGSLQEKGVFLTTEPSHQPPNKGFCKVMW